ncbi:MAG: sigma-54-dependent transcriptional regulator [Vulcanimicrobiota bacterium]
MFENNKSVKILLVDDSEDTLELLERNLSQKKFTVLTAQNATTAIDILNTTEINLVITDLKMPGYNGNDLIRYTRENFKFTEIIMITGYATVESAVEAIKLGAEQYVPKPFTDDELFEAVDKALEKLKQKNLRALAPDTHYHGLIGNSDAMKKVFKTINKAARSLANVLISGESGTGKELVARAIHYNSERASSSFVPVNCGAIPESLIESELFGHIKGAFTGANSTRAGFFQTANGGTIFLDEIGDTSPAMQTKLLRVIQEKEVCMVGSRKNQKFDIRVLAATNKNLFELVKKGHFREDLYYRLNVIPLELPPLRERGDDILLLAEHFLQKAANDIDKKPPVFGNSVLRIFKTYPWPGNIRELENIVQRIVLMAEGDTIDVPDLPSHMRFAIPTGFGVNKTLAEVETEHIKNVLSYVSGNKTEAARILGIARKTLRRKIQDN